MDILESTQQTYKFRQEFRTSSIPHWYHGPVHILLSFTLLMASFVTPLSFIDGNTFVWTELLMIPLTFLLGNVVVFVVHKYPLHRNTMFSRYAYKMHTKFHHRFYTYDVIVPQSTDDFFILFFPMRVVLSFAFIVLPLFYYVSMTLWSVNAGLLLVSFSGFYFLLYEVFHSISHLPDEHWIVKNFAWGRKMRHLHRLHHDPRLMTNYNFNIVYPLMDIITGHSINERPPVNNSNSEQDPNHVP